MKNDNTKSLTSGRILYMDVLRVLATFAVIIIHVKGDGWLSLISKTFEWQIQNFLNAATRWCVPIFVMISGALFLNRKCNIKKLFSKNILKIIISFVFWSVAYGVYSFIIRGKSLKLVVGEIIVGHYHMWFLVMIAGLYLATPLLKKIVEEKKLTVYFLVLAFIFASVIPQMVDFVSLFSESISNSMKDILEMLNFNIAVGYTGYFVLGYFLSEIELTKKHRKIIYALGAIGFAVSICLPTVLSLLKGETVECFYEYNTVNILLESAAIFVFFKYRKINLSGKSEKLLLNLSKYSFGVYLAHPLVIELGDYLFGINTMIANPVLSISVNLIIVSVISFILSAVINKIPFLKKYIV